MNRQVLLELPDDVAETLAQRSPERAGSLVARAIRTILAAEAGDNSPVASLSDREVIAVAELTMPAQADARQVALMRLREARKLSADEESEFWELVRLYDRLLLRKSEGLAEAVRRGLRPPLSP
jgi:hypothetical protein